MDNSNIEELNRLMRDPENKACIDCGSSTQWASVNNAVFLCLNCAGRHRGLGVNISFVRSITMDKWDAKQVKLMTIGGNRRMKKLLGEYCVPEDIDLATKYKLKALDYYRRKLRAEAFNEEPPEKPDHITAFEQIKTFKTSNELNDINFGSVQGGNQEYYKQEPSLFNSMGTFFTNTMSDLQNGIKDIKIKEKTIDLSKNAVHFMGEKTSEVMNSYLVQSIFKKSKELFKGKSQEVTDSRRGKPIEHKIKEEHYPCEVLMTNSLIGEQIKPSQSLHQEQNIYDFFSPPAAKKQIMQKEKDDLLNQLFTSGAPSINFDLKAKGQPDQPYQHIPSDLFSSNYQ